YPLLNDVSSVRQAGYDGLGHTLLSESRLLVLRAPFSPRMVGQKWHDPWAKTGVVPCVWKEHCASTPARPILNWTLRQRFSTPQSVRWRKAIPCVPPGGSSRSIKIRLVRGCI